MKLAKFFLLGFSVLTMAVTAYGHHSFPATYNVDVVTELQGEVVAFLYRNPHATIQVMVTESSGEKIRYLIEWAGAAALEGSGVSRGTLVPGDKVVISGNPGRNAADHRMRLVSIRRPSDGWTWGQEYN
jgi:Family of unknown function (DUF6152)